MRVRPVSAFAIATFVGLVSARDTSAEERPTAKSRALPSGAGMVAVLGPFAEAVLAPDSRLVGALVRLPYGTDARAVGLDPVAPGIGRLRAPAKDVVAFANAHPEWPLEVAPPLKLLLDKVGPVVQAPLARKTFGVDGTGVLVGVADTGCDVTHADFRNDDGTTRVAWLLDLSLKPVGLHPELEDRFGVKSATGELLSGAVLEAAEIDALLAAKKALPTDGVGHGTHVTSLAAGNGGKLDRRYVGMAPKAGIVCARVTKAEVGTIENDDLLRGVDFIFDRGDAMGRPVVANMSVGTDFGPHDGTTAWEETIASHVGPDKPGHAIVVAVGNSGSIVEQPVHQNAYVSEGAVTRIPVTTNGADNGGVQVWITKHAGADLKVGLDSPDGTWIHPIADGTQEGASESGHNAGVIHGSGAPNSPIPKGSSGAIVLWQGKWPKGTYDITLVGHGLVDLYLQVIGDAASGNVGFARPVRAGTVNLPGTHPNILAVGCSVTRPRWTAISGTSVGLQSPLLDAVGGLRDPSNETRSLIDGDSCWFSSAGPTATGLPKPEISAPGAMIVGAMSSAAGPGSPFGIFSTGSCPPKEDGTTDLRCLQMDATHGLALGTSMSAPIVSGAIALLFQRDRSLTQEDVVTLLQAGAHRFRHRAAFDDQAGPGELDVLGALDALEQRKNPELSLPSVRDSWLALSTDFVAADGSRPAHGILELRTKDGEHRADAFDPTRLRATVRVFGGESLPTPALTRRGPGLFTFPITPTPGLGGRALIVGATFDGEPIVHERSIPVGTDTWTADYPMQVAGGCAVVPARTPAPPLRSTTMVGLGLAIVALRFRRRALVRASLPRA
ncbi:MAG: S8 family serine peptidase [Polyangiaceae bacterium]